MAILLLFLLIVSTADYSDSFSSPESYWSKNLPNTILPEKLKSIMGTTVTNEFTSHLNGLSYMFYKDSQEPNLSQNITLFFLPKFLFQGKKMQLNFPKYENNMQLLPRSMANKFPLCSQTILKLSSKFNYSSEELSIANTTVKACTIPSIAGEKKLCVSSLENMVDFCVETIGQNVQSLMNKIEEHGDIRDYVVEDYKILGTAPLACHPLAFPFGIFYCHVAENSKSYKVILKRDDDVYGEVGVVCHKNTEAWDVNHVAFKLLQVKPGTPICHFIDSISIILTPITV